MYASINGQTEIVQLLLQRPDLDINIQTPTKMTAFAYAFILGHNDIINLLLSHDNFNIELNF
jgi:ankyrin repeat protein